MGRFVLLPLMFLALSYGPGLWVRRMFARHDAERPDLSHTGEGFAKLLLQQNNVKGVLVETTDKGDHYDPLNKTIRLSKRNSERRSLTAMTVAFHEVGHALQHAEKYNPLMVRTHALGWTLRAERFGSGALIASAVVGFFAPAAARQLLVGGALCMLATIPVHFITLPVEFDASFNRALPLMRKMEMPEPDLAAARNVLLACALTYVAAALGSLLNIRHWIRVLLRR